jgi:hypothetical protein
MRKQHYLMLVLPDGSKRLVGREIHREIHPRRVNAVGKAGALAYLGFLVALAVAAWSLL